MEAKPNRMMIPYPPALVICLGRLNTGVSKRRVGVVSNCTSFIGAPSCTAHDVSYEGCAFRHYVSCLKKSSPLTIGSLSDCYENHTIIATTVSKKTR